MERITISLLLILIISGVKGQMSLPDVELDGWYCCDVDGALQKISSLNDVAFDYDVDRLKKISFSKHPTNWPLESFLNQICKDNKLKYYVSADTVIHIVDKWYNLEMDKIENSKSYEGKATKWNFQFSGKIIDRETRETLPFVSIISKETKMGVTSNVDGYFTMLKTPSDTSTLILRYIGYQSKEIYLTPSTNVSDITIELEPEVQNIDEVTITAERQDVLQVVKNRPGIIKMSPRKLKSLPNLGEKDVFRSFQLMPGISAANENSSGLYIRGGTPDQVLVLYDGFTVYNVEHMFGFFSAFNSNAIKDVQLYKGGFDAKYGGRLSGVVEITGKEGDEKGFNMGADISMMSMNAFVEFPVGEQIRAIFSARRSWESPIYKKIFNQFTDENESMLSRPGGDGPMGGMPEQETSSYFYDLNGKVTYRPNKKDIFGFSIYSGKDNLDNSIAPKGRMAEMVDLDMESIDLTNWGNTGSSVKWSRRHSNKLYFNGLLSFSNYFSNRERSTDGSFHSGDESNSISRGICEDNNLFDYTAKMDVEYELFQNHKLGMGTQITYNDIDYTYTQNDTLTIIDRSTDGQIYAGYLQDRISFFQGDLNITPGIRASWFSETEKFYYEPRVSLTWQLSDKIRFKSAYGEYYQFAKRVIREDITTGSRDFWVLSDNNKLPVGFSRQYTAGLSFETNHFLFDLEGFYKDLDNITEYSLRIAPKPGQVEYSENFFTGTGISRGVDFLLQKKFGDFTGWIGYTYAQVVNHIDDFGDYDFYASQDVTHEFKTVFSYKFRNWDFGATWIYATGKPYTAPEGGYELTLLDGTVQDYINVSVKNGLRLPDYHRLDLSATYNFKLGNAPASIGASIFNVYDRANVWYKEFEIVDNVIVETPVYYLGLTPNINLTIKLK